MASKRHSEILLEGYLSGLGTSYWHEPDAPGKSKHPDYLIEHAGVRTRLEVKEFDEPKEKPTGGFSPCPPIADMIGRARKQFKEYRDDCCALVLHSCKSIYRSTHLEAVLSAMFGEAFQCRPLSLISLVDAPYRFRFSGPSKLNKASNTTISAVIILQHYQVNEIWVSIFHELLDRQNKGEVLPPGASLQALAAHQDDPTEITHPDKVRAVVLENPYARIPFPKDLCAGPFDQRWGQDGYDYTLLWIGSELVRLRERDKPVPFVHL